VKRRDFIALVGGAAAWPLAARAAAGNAGDWVPQHPIPRYADRLRAFRQGLKDTGYIEGESLAIEYSWAEGKTQGSSVTAKPNDSSPRCEPFLDLIH
jgi:putative ABC transport system substrate-binding protein